jgi:hypothetical protein
VFRPNISRCRASIDIQHVRIRQEENLAIALPRNREAWAFLCDDDPRHPAREKIGLTGDKAARTPIHGERQA